MFVFEPFEFASGFGNVSYVNASYRSFRSRKTAGTAKTAMASICSQFIADFLQLGQRNLQSGNILPQWSHEEIIASPHSLLILLRRSP